MMLAVRDAHLKLGVTRVLRQVSLEVTPGSVTALVGPNGAGKTSLLRVLAGEMPLTQGHASLNGRTLNRMSPQELARRRGVVTQSTAMAFDFYVEEVLEMGWTHNCRANLARAAAQVAGDCDIAHLAGRRFNTLSGGEQQRVQFARALLQAWQPPEEVIGPERREPFYLLLDEPTSSLDLAHEQLVLRLARQARDYNIGVLMILHDLNLASHFADRVVLLVGGCLAATGRPEEVFTDRILSSAYGTGVHVEWHGQLSRLFIHAH